jgi:hypothetical protein
LRNWTQERCQFENSVYRYTWPLGMVRAVRNSLRRLRVRGLAGGRGAASAFAPGDVVRVLDRDAVRASLDARGTLRGLLFTDEQWATCGNT